MTYSGDKWKSISDLGETGAICAFKTWFKPEADKLMSNLVTRSAK